MFEIKRFLKTLSVFIAISLAMIPFSDGVPFDAVKLVMMPFYYEEKQLVIMAFLYNTALFIISFIIIANEIGTRFSMNDYVLTRISKTKTGIKNLIWSFKTASSLSAAKIIADLIFSRSQSLKDIFNIDFWLGSLSFLLTILIWNNIIIILKSVHIRDKSIMFVSLAMGIVTQAFSLKLPVLGILNMVPATFEVSPLIWISAKIVTVLLLSIAVLVSFEKYESLGEIKND